MRWLGDLETDPTLTKSAVIDVFLELLTWLMSDHSHLAIVGYRRRLTEEAYRPLTILLSPTNTSVQSSRKSLRLRPTPVPILSESDSPLMPRWMR